VKKISIMHYVFDIDGTICITKNGDYNNSIPIPERIKKINELFNLGHIINFHTARGMRTFKNDAEEVHKKYYQLTYDQLIDWGVKFNSLFMGKPSGDLYVDDKATTDEEFFRH
tara:strand:- start:390 stop:728 length:339 start_codon:yes stop_codon:yes gene_type:complete